MVNELELNWIAYEEWDTTDLFVGKQASIHFIKLKFDSQI